MSVPPGSRVTLFGAGGPVGVMATRALRDTYRLRLTEVWPLADLAAEGRPQSPGAPLPEPLPAPHEESVVDVFDYAQVLDASRGAQALINCTVVRHDTAGAFRVNVAGAYHVAKAAVELGIRRIIHTGPQLVMTAPPVDYADDFNVPDDVPPRGSSHRYSLSKYLSEELTRVFAEAHGLEVACFTYCQFRPADWSEDADGSGVFHFTTAWEDTGAPFLKALQAPSSAFERPYERFHITSRLPQGKFGHLGKAKRLLDWEPEHDFSRLYRRPGAGTPQG